MAFPVALYQSGDYVVKGAPAYGLKAKDREKAEVYTFIEQGTILTVANVKPGDEVKRGQSLINLVGLSP